VAAVALSRGSLLDLVRPALAGLTGVVLAVLAGHVFDDVMWAFLMTPVIVTSAVVVAHRWGAVIETAAAVVAIVVSVLGATLAADGSFTDVVPGIARGPKRLLSTEWPSPTEPTMVATLALLVATCTALSVSTSLRPRWRLLPLAPFTVGAVVLIGLSAPTRPSTWLLVAAGALIVAIAGWTGANAVQRTRTWTPERTVTATVVAVALVGLGAATALAWTDRANPRDTTEPETSATLLDPVEAMVAMRRAEPVLELMTISDRSLLSRPTMPSRWRLAAFDEYDGQRWTPHLGLRPIGGRLGEAPPGTESDVLDYLVRYHTDLVDLVPLPGDALAIDRDVETDLDRIAVRLTDDVGADTAIEVSALTAPTVTDAADDTVLGRPADDLSSGFVDVARTMAGEGSDVDRLGALAQAMRFDWALDTGAPGAGQQIALIDRFVNVTERGTREQFVTAYALMARALGYESRIAAGFVVEADELGSTFDLRTDQAAVWPEVQLADGRWLAFDPVPPREATDEVERPEPQAQTPAAAQPPAPPPAESTDNPEDTTVEEQDAGDRWGSVATWVRRTVTVSAIVLTPIILLVGGLLLAKRYRRRSRLRTDDPVLRVRGAWANVTDSLVDAGLAIAPSWTDDRIADSAGAVAVGVPHETHRLAAMSSTVTFGTRSSDEARRLADDAATTAAAVEAAIRRSRTRWQRARWRLSLRSFRPSTRSPVTP
jgi:hypothetical protein